jgi:hypothetical protein
MSGAERFERFVVWQMEEGKWIVLSLDSTSGKPKQYCVTTNGYRLLCNCPHFLKHCEDVNFVCKHIQAVLQTIGQQTEVAKKTKTANIEDRIKKLEERLEMIERDVAYAINPANFS